MSGSLNDFSRPCRADSTCDPSSTHFIQWVCFLQLVILILTAIGTSAEEPYIGYSDYQILTDPRFDSASYFQQMQYYGVNLQRIWAAGYGHVSREIQEDMPFARHGRKYDLSRIDMHYVARLRKVFQAAEEAEQRVLFTLFDRWQMGSADRFVQTPWYYKNNTSRFLRTPFPDFYNLEKKEWRAIQENYVRTLVRETKQYEPIYEIMNEAKLPGDCRMLAEWHEAVAGWIRMEAPGAEIAVNTLDNCPALFEVESVDWISLHYADWSSGICSAINRMQPYGKRILIDTDGAFLQRGDNQLVRGWLLDALGCGASFNHKDDIYKLDSEVLKVFRESRALTRRSEN